MDSPSSTVRRQAWIQSSRQCHTHEDPDLLRPPPDLSSTSYPSTTMSHDDVFSNEHKWENSFEDDLSLGADASEINLREIQSDRGLSTSTSCRKPLPLNIGHSMVSCHASSTIKTGSSMSEVLQSCSEDAEETLYQLGFGCDELGVPARIPVRFLTFPSQLRGINFRLFLQSQLQRVREEDPGLSLASRFRQVEVLTAMANAFYSLYSHVSRTALHKLSPPDPIPSPSPMEKLERFRSSVRSEPRSPVERLKDTVSKMCLYTGAQRESDNSPLPSPSKRPSLPDVDIVWEKAKIKSPRELYLLDSNLTEETLYFRRTEHRPQTPVDGTTKQYADITLHKEVENSKRSDTVESDWNKVTSSDLEHGRSSPSRKAWLETSHISSELALNRGSTQNLACDAATISRPADSIGVAEASDEIHPETVGNAHRAPLCRLHTDNVDTDHLAHRASERNSPVRSWFGLNGPHKTSEPPSKKVSGISDDEDEVSADSRLEKAGQAGPLKFPPLHHSAHCPCCITVSGWEGDDVTALDTQGPIYRLSSPSEISGEEAPSPVNKQYLSPLKHRNLTHISSKHRQANSFEMEEVSSAGEDDFGQSETTKHQYKGGAAVVRGDSMQSDSSGYAEDEVSPSADIHASSCHFEN